MLPAGIMLAQHADLPGRRSHIYVAHATNPRSDVMTETQLPDCGLYRTGIALPSRSEDVPAGSLVYFHNHSDQGSPMVVTPHDNENNCWRFHERGWSVEDSDFIEKMVPLKPEGLYLNTRHLHITREEVIPERTLIQLGYNRKADTILFVGRFEGNAIVFPHQGYAFESAQIQETLEPASFHVPRKPKTEEVN